MRISRYYLLIFCFVVYFPLRAYQNEMEMEPAISPDGKQIAFRGIVNGNSDIYIVNIDGSDPVRVTSSDEMEGQPAWSPDGRQLAFFSNRDGNFEIYTIALQTMAIKRRTNHPAMNLVSFWLESDNILYYTSDDNGDQIRALDLVNGEDRLWSTSFEHHHSLQLSADGNLWGVIKDGKDWELALAEPSGENPKVIAANPSRDSAPRISPTEQLVVFTSKRGTTGDWEIFIMNTDGTNVRQLTDSNGRNSSPQWLPGGEAILFASNSGGGFHLYIMNSDGKDQRQLMIGW